MPAGLFVAYLVSSGDVGWIFQPLRPGHQGLYTVTGLLLLAGIVLGGAGWTREAEEKTPECARKELDIPTPAVAHRWFLFSAVCVATGLWVSAVLTETLLLMLFLAMLFLVLKAPSSLDSGVRVQPVLWRQWGRLAAIGSFAFYLLEYFPHHLALTRLEVNGPMYAAGVLAEGEAIYHFLKAKYGDPHRRKRHIAIGLMATFIVLAVPGVILLGPQSWHALRDPQMIRFHYFIEEFFSMQRFAGAGMFALLVRSVGIMPLFLLVAIALAAFFDLRLGEWIAIWLSFALTLGVLGMGYLQVRWLGVYATLNAWTAVLVGVSAWRIMAEKWSEGKRAWLKIIVPAILLLQPIDFIVARVRTVDDIVKQRTVPKNLVNLVLYKRMALGLLASEGAGTRVMAEPDLAPALQYFGEGESVASFYWENLAGLHAATAFFTDSVGETARKIAADRGLTHVVVKEGNRLPNYFYFYATGTLNQEEAKKTLAARLMGSELELPNWIETTPRLQQLAGAVYTYGGMNLEERWRIYRIRMDSSH
jgi:hypothetical protein